jgi:hypothetical protein
MVARNNEVQPASSVARNRVAVVDDHLRIRLGPAHKAQIAGDQSGNKNFDLSRGRTAGKDRDHRSGKR